MEGYGYLSMAKCLPVWPSVQIPSVINTQISEENINDTGSA